MVLGDSASRVGRQLVRQAPGIEMPPTQLGALHWRHPCLGISSVLDSIIVPCPLPTVP